MRDQLFLLKPGFFDGDQGPFYCGDSVAIEGLLSFFPEIKDAVDIKYVDFPRPRADIVAHIGADNQSMPVLLIEDATVVEGIAFKTALGKQFIDDEAQIRRYLSLRYGVASAR
jgi:hypothetical protein